MKKVIQTIQELTSMRSKLPSQSIGFVPTMGYLHQGHLSLVRKAREENDKVFVSIFVNPTQFGPNEDLSRYPRDLERDIKLLENLGVDVIFTPSVEEIYPEGFQTYVEPTGPFVDEAEGKIRPGHFRGVATVVLKLFNIVKPTNVYFGQKDAQQALVVAKLIKDLNLNITLHIMPIIREKDGLAMSSRNAYLNPEERKAAIILYQSLLKTKESLASNPGQHSDILKNVRTNFAEEPLAELEYFEMRDPETFEELKTLRAPALLLIAARVGKTRLIDNFVLNADNTWETGVII